MLIVNRNIGTINRNELKEKSGEKRQEHTLLLCRLKTNHKKMIRNAIYNVQCWNTTYDVVQERTENGKRTFNTYHWCPYAVYAPYFN